MNILCTSSRIVSRQRPEQGIRQISDAGFTDVFLDLAAYISARELEWYGKSDKPPGQAAATGHLEDRQKQETIFSEHPEEFQNFLISLCKQYNNAGLHFSVAQIPHLSLSTKRNDLNELLLNLAQISIETYGRAGGNAVIVKPLLAGIPNEKIWEANRTYYLSLAEAAAKYGITILLENQCKSQSGRLVRGICAEVEEAIEWVDALNKEAEEERFGFCVDIGACNICGQYINDFICRLGSRIKAVRVRDCDGRQDASQLPFTCMVQGHPQSDWKNLIWALRKISFDGFLILDFKDTLSGFSPFLRSKLLGLAKSVGDYLAWQIGMEQFIHRYEQVVLFGAGNMCRNYMKHYGEKKPPLFTCDNNSKLWGTTYCGLEVNSPEKLKSLPGNCAIVICNMFYQEIMQQLHDMGLNNPIICFNDEMNQ